MANFMVIYIQITIIHRYFKKLLVEWTYCEWYLCVAGVWAGCTEQWVGSWWTDWQWSWMSGDVGLLLLICTGWWLLFQGRILTSLWILTLELDEQHITSFTKSKLGPCDFSVSDWPIDIVKLMALLCKTKYILLCYTQQKSAEVSYRWPF